MDSEPPKSGDSQRGDKRRNSQLCTAAPGTGTEPDNKYYEVDAILDGPRKRREHLFKYCYKVRWKGYGPEADTWQPIADLTNVQDMIEDYKKEKAMKQREKGKKKSPEKNHGIVTRRTSSLSQMSSSDDSDSDDDQQYDPVYGTVKDKFWKDLELGRHQNHAQLFCGDMYSKVKGCRRAAHAEAVANIQRQQQLLSKPHLLSGRPSLSTAESLLELVPCDFQSAESVTLLSSKTACSSGRSPRFFNANRVRKRSSDPFSARGYMSTKRSRKSRETKVDYLIPVDKTSSISCETSETVDSNNGTSIVEINNCLQSTVGSSDLSQLNPHIADLSKSALNGDVNSKIEDISDDDMFLTKTEENSQDTILVDSNTSVIGHSDSETQPSLEVQVADCKTVHLNKAADVLPGECLSTVTTETCCLTQSSHVNVGASGSGSEINAGPSYDAGGGTSGGTVPGPSVINTTSSPKRSHTDTQSEASGAIEKSHDEECLWNGACNRSDCKSNRRRNMKNGHSKRVRSKNPAMDNENHAVESEIENESQNNSDSTITDDENQDRHYENTQPASYEETEAVCRDNVGHQEVISNMVMPRNVKKSQMDRSPKSTNHTCCLGGTIYHDGSSPLKIQSSSPASLMSTSCKITGSSKPSSTQSHSGGQMCRSLFATYQADSSDSSFDESPSIGPPLSREAVSDSFCQTDSPSACHLDTRTPSFCCAHKLESLVGNASWGATEIRKKIVEVERPGLFSDSNSTFSFTRQDSGFSGDSGSVTPVDQHGHFMVPSPTNRIGLCSPGKENFSSSKSGGLITPSGYNRLQIPVMDTSSSHSDLGSQVQSPSSQPRIFSEPSDNRAARKRGSETSQPLEKIPSPNSRDSDLDRRINTLTCDELEDFIEQGEDSCNQKDVAFITNADLLQAVNLSKAEVVKRAVQQSRLNEHKLDFEQPDNSGFTLLMRAVQKGTVAIVEMLLDHGVHVNAQQTNGTTALMIAAEQNGMCLVALLLKYGANSSLYTIHTDKAETALMKAVKRQHHDIVNLMLRVGVNTAAPTCTSISALELAVERRNPHIERLIRFHNQRLHQAFQSCVLATLEGTAELVEPLFPMQCFPLRESHEFVIKFNSSIHPVSPGEGFLLFIAHTKITDKGVRCRFHGSCPINSVTINGIVQSPLTKDVNFITSCHPIIQGCNTLIIYKMADYTSKAKLVVQAFRARLLAC